MIRRLGPALVLLPLMLVGAGCAPIVVSGNVGYLMLIPIFLDDGRQMDATGTSYYDTHWFADPDSHPAVRPAPKKTAPVPAGQ